MNGSKKLYDGITYINEDIIEEAQNTELKKRPTVWLRLGVAAACICLVGTGLFYAARYFGVLPGGASAGGSGGEGLSYMSYAGPVFPLAVRGDVSGLTAQRSVNFDFSPYHTVTEQYEVDGEERSYDRHESESIVTDRYVLHNDSDIDKTVTAVYPFAGSFRDDLDILPVITLDGEKRPPSLYAGPYSGGFRGVSGADDPDSVTSVNLAHLDRWEGYRALIGNGYRERAFDEWPELDRPVVIYELSDRSARESDFKEGNPTLNLEFTIDYDKTTVLTYGMNGGTNDPATGYCARNTHVPQSFNPDYGQSTYLIVLGDDIRDYGLQGYKDGGCEKGGERESVTATVTRRETTLDMIFAQFARQFLDEREQEKGNNEPAIWNVISDEMFLGAAAELLTDYGLLSDTGAQRYEFGMLEDIFSETHAMQRVMYLAFEVTVPAGGSTELSASMVKKASFDYIGDNKKRNGYDMVTRLGSEFDFVSQTASVSSTEDIEIINQNFGFDLADGVDEVRLDPMQEHYYLEVIKRAE